MILYNEEDAGAWAIEVIAAPGAEEGDFVTVCSWASSVNELVKTYDQVRKTEVVVRTKGTLEDLEMLAVARKAAGGAAAVSGTGIGCGSIFSSQKVVGTLKIFRTTTSMSGLRHW